MRITNGKDKFNYSSFLKLCLTYRPNINNKSNYDQTVKTLFKVMDIDSDDKIIFDDYLQTCYIITRGCVESKLESMKPHLFFLHPKKKKKKEKNNIISSYLLQKFNLFNFPCFFIHN